MKNTTNNIPNLSDADFLSFLYSERDRENNLSQYHGWNNWALVGAAATVFCAMYSIVKQSDEGLNFHDVLFYISGLVALIMNCHTLKTFIDRPRGVDYSKVRTVKEVAPITYIRAVLICSIALVVLFAVKGWWGITAWLWTTVLVVFAIARIYIIISKHKIVPSFTYYYTSIFADYWIEIVFNLIVIMLVSNISNYSLKEAPKEWINSDFEFSVCFSVVLWLFYFLIKINVENKPVKEFDVIIDDYLYKGATKEYTYNRILTNRMGAGVIDACKKEITMIIDDIDSFSKKRELIEQYNKDLDVDAPDIKKLNDIVFDLDDVIDYLLKTLKHLGKLNAKIGQIRKILPSVDKVEDFVKIIDTTNQLIDQIDKLKDDTAKVIAKAKNKIDSFYCKKFGAYCLKKNCIQRNDSKSYGYIIRRWVRIGRVALQKII